LAALGIPVIRKLTVGDVREDIRDAVALAMESAHLVLVTGGLGPTRDDITRDVVAELLQASMVVHDRLLEALKDRYRARGYDDIPSNIFSQVMVPEEGEHLDNPVGTAPGLVFHQQGSTLILLPGVPREMRAIFLEGVRGLIERDFGGELRSVFHRTIYTTGVPESVLAREIEALLPSELGPVTLSFLPDVHSVRVRLTARGTPDGDEAEEWLDRIEEEISPALARCRFDAASGDLVEPLSLALTSSDRTLAVAESCTGGLIAKRLTDLPGSTSFFLGGVVAYANETKVQQLDVPPEVIEEEGAVSRKVAESMALGVARRFGSSAGMGVTGIAGPGGGTEEKPVGSVWYAVVLGDRIEARFDRFPGDRDAVRERASQAAMALLLELLGGFG
jgi:nicotinamide-nucleotide amidase